jgi:hypothetical protein
VKTSVKLTVLGKGRKEGGKTVEGGGKSKDTQGQASLYFSPGAETENTEKLHDRMGSS